MDHDPAAALRSVLHGQHGARVRAYVWAGDGMLPVVDLAPGGTLIDLVAIKREAEGLLGVPVDAFTDGALRAEALTDHGA